METVWDMNKCVILMPYRENYFTVLLTDRLHSEAVGRHSENDRNYGLNNCRTKNKQNNDICKSTKISTQKSITTVY